MDPGLQIKTPIK